MGSPNRKVCPGLEGHRRREVLDDVLRRLVVVSGVVSLKQDLTVDDEVAVAVDQRRRGAESRLVVELVAPVTR